MLIWLKKKNIIKHKKELISYVKIGKLVLTLGNIETEKKWILPYDSFCE